MRMGKGKKICRKKVQSGKILREFDGSISCGYKRKDIDELEWVGKRMWQWIDELVWKLTGKCTLRLRRKKYDLFMSLMRPKRGEKILDVGVPPYAPRGRNSLEQWCPYPENITALTNGEPEKFEDLINTFQRENLFLVAVKKTAIRR